MVGKTKKRKVQKLRLNNVTTLLSFLQQILPKHTKISFKNSKRQYFSLIPLIALLVDSTRQ